MIILVGAQKGGCGKSTIAVNISASLAMINMDTVLVDADRQSTASNWATDRSNNKKLSTVHCVQKYGNIRETLLDLNSRYQCVVVDASGRDSRELRTGITAAHILIIPFRPSQPDLDTLPKMQEIITQGSDINPKIKILALLTMAPTNPLVNEENEAETYIKEYPDIKLIKTIIRERKVYRDAMSEGKSVIEMDNIKAKREFLDAMEEIMGVQNG